MSRLQKYRDHGEKAVDTLCRRRIPHGEGAAAELPDVWRDKGCVQCNHLQRKTEGVDPLYRGINGEFPNQVGQKGHNDGEQEAERYTRVEEGA